MKEDQMLIAQTLKSLGMLFLLMIPGFIFKKKNVLDEKQNNALNAFVVNVTWPCMVVDAMQISFDDEILRNCGNMILKLLVIFAATAVLCLLIAKVFHFQASKCNLFIFMAIFGNTGFVGMPIIGALYGKEALFYASVIEAFNDIMIFTVGMILIQRASGVEVKLELKQFINPCLIGSVIGVLLFLLGIKLPDVIGQPVSMLANTTAPIAMSVLGFQLGGLSLRNLAKDASSYVAVITKLIAVPVVAFIIIRLWPGMAVIDKTLVIDMGMPIAVMASLLSQRYGGDVEYPTKSVLLSTIALIVTVPVFAILLETI